MRVLIACEFSGIVRDAFLARGHDAVSCDLLPTDIVGPHYQGSVLDIIDQGWDLMIAHPPCTYLTVAGAGWFYHPEDKHLSTSERRPHPKYPNRRQDQREAVEFVKTLMASPIPRIALENPIGALSTQYRKPDQIIQPWQFGHPETKATCLWLKGLPKLAPSNIVELPEKRSERMKLHYLPPSEDRWKLRSTTFRGIAEAMADQWG